ncbi:three-helix bundle dimerization domain-containing protein [Streptomyces sp. NPDC004539]|uniref:three-helix bundle dimerization domain-containing protein n=1 Tax=Streptomyces sp. NPDC004539 TaxID=3154280 RepID=UPI00339DEF95
MHAKRTPSGSHGAPQGPHSARHPVEEIEAAVATAHASFSDRRIRDFVPVLVERKARAALDAPSG